MAAKNPNRVYSGKVGAKMKPKSFKTKRSAGKIPMSCFDGPWKKHKFFVCSRTSLPLNIAGQVGRYVDGFWVALS